MIVSAQNLSFEYQAGDWGIINSSVSDFQLIKVLIKSVSIKSHFGHQCVYKYIVCWFGMWRHFMNLKEFQCSKLPIHWIPSGHSQIFDVDYSTLFQRFLMMTKKTLKYWRWIFLHFQCFFDVETSKMPAGSLLIKLCLVHEK